VVMIGPGATDDTLGSLHEQTHTDWVAAHVPETGEPLGFPAQLVTTFLKTDGASCEFVVFVLAGTRLAPHALQRIANAVSAHDAQIVYGDLDIQSKDGSVWPLALPAFDYERMLEQGYCAHLFAISRGLAERSLGDGGCDVYRLFYAALEDTELSRSAIVHLPGALGMLPLLDRQAASTTLMAASRAHLARKGVAADLTPGSAGIFPAVRVARHCDHLSTTIIIPIRNHRAQLARCIESIGPAVRRQNAEIIVVDNDSADPETLKYLEEIKENTARVLRIPGDFNLARLNNCAATAARGEILCLLNHDTKATDNDWLTEMLSRITDPHVGAVGALLLWPSGVVQHGGLVLGPNFAPAPAFSDRVRGDGGYGDLLCVAHECSAVTAACLLTRRNDYLAVGGMDEVRFPVTFNDVDFCLKLRARQKRIVFTPHARLLSLQSAHLGPDHHGGERNRVEREYQNLRNKWGSVLAADPYYSPVLSLDPLPFSALAWPARSMEPRTNRSPTPVMIPPEV
jgi:GT2 family glycosyltransferase